MYQSMYPQGISGSPLFIRRVASYPTPFLTLEAFRSIVVASCFAWCVSQDDPDSALRLGSVRYTIVSTHTALSDFVELKFEKWSCLFPVV
jgi:hypothetical protein